MWNMFKKQDTKIKDDLLYIYKFKLDTIEEAVRVMDDEQLVKAIRKLFIQFFAQKNKNNEIKNKID